LFLELLLVTSEVVLNFSNVGQDGEPMRVGHEEGLCTVNLHDADILSDVVNVAIFSFDFSNAVSVRVQGHADRGAKTVAPARVDGSVCSRGTSSLRAVGHERKNQALKSIDAILHVVWGACGYVVDAGLLASAGRGIEA
jgi:hypothetical protein